jgi:large repetitive protein
VASGDRTDVPQSTRTRRVGPTPHHLRVVESAAWPPDTTAPDTEITEKPVDPTTERGASLSFTGTDDRTPGPELGYECRLGSQDFLSCSSPKHHAELGLGSHTFEVGAFDQAGNVDQTPATRTWTIVPAADKDKFTGLSLHSHSPGRE